MPSPTPEIIEAALKVQRWAESQCAKPGQWWAVGGVQSRGSGTRVEQALMAAHRLLNSHYTPWNVAGGLNECEHGYGRPAFHCPKCDRALVEAAVEELG